MAYTEEPTAYLLAGRTLRIRDCEQDEFDELCARIDEMGGELHKRLVVIPEGDFTETGVPVSERVALECVVGLLVEETGTYPALVDHEALTAALASARELPWEAIMGLVPDLVEEPEVLARGWFGKEVGLYATACGPLAGVMLGYGVLSELRENYDYDDYYKTHDSDDDEDQPDDEERFLAGKDTVAAVMPALELVRGNLETQVPQSEAVYGVWVTRALWDGRMPVPVDISQAAHQDRAAKLGPLAEQSNYYLIGHYD